MTTLPYPNMQDALRVKKLVPDAILPKQANDGDAGYDLVAIDDGTWDSSGTFIQYRTGIAIEVPPGYHTEIFPRSSVSKYDLVLANSVGLVDYAYRGEVLCRFKYVPRLQLTNFELPIFPGVQIPSGATGSYYKVVEPTLLYRKGDKIAQLVIRKTINLQVMEFDSLSETVRGSNGFGSSGK